MTKRKGHEMAAIDKNSIEKNLLAWFRIEGSHDIKDDGTIDVTGTCKIRTDHPEGSKLPFRFGNVTDEFNIGAGGLISLQGCPSTVGHIVIAINNPLTSLQGLSRISDLDFDGSIINLANCKLENLSGMQWARNMDVSHNPGLKSLQGMPDHDLCQIEAVGCNLKDLQGCPTKCRHLDITNQLSLMGSLEGLPSRLQSLSVDDNAPMLKLLEVLWGTKADRANEATFKSYLKKNIRINGDQKKADDIMTLVAELYKDRHDGIPAFALDLIKLGYRQNAHF